MNPNSILVPMGISRMLTSTKHNASTTSLSWAMALIVWSALFSGTALQAQYTPEKTFTVLTNSGVNVRKGPGTQYAKVATLPFGTVVKAEYTDDMKRCQGDPRYVADDLFPAGYLKIEEKRGFWIEITHKGISGYVFSGFGILGEKWPTPSEDIDQTPVISYKTPDSPMSDYSIFYLQGCGERLQDFDPRMNWYALTRNQTGLKWAKANAWLKLPSEMTAQELGGELPCPRFVRCDVKGAEFLVGTRIPLADEQLQRLSTTGLSFQKDESELGLILKLNQQYDFEWAGHSYMLRAFRCPMRPGLYGEQDTTDVGLELRVSEGDGAQYFDLAKLIGFSGTWDDKAIPYFKCLPQLDWVGDVNADGYADFLYFVVDDETCYVSSHQVLIVSEKTPSGVAMHRATIWNGFGY